MNSANWQVLIKKWLVLGYLHGIGLFHHSLLIAPISEHAWTTHVEYVNNIPIQFFKKSPQKFRHAIVIMPKCLCQKRKQDNWLVHYIQLEMQLKGHFLCYSAYNLIGNIGKFFRFCRDSSLYINSRHLKQCCEMQASLRIKSDQFPVAENWQLINVNTDIFIGSGILCSKIVRPEAWGWSIDWQILLRGGSNVQALE